MCRRIALALLTGGLAVVVASASATAGNDTNTDKRACNTINLGGPKVFSKENMRCATAKHHARRVYKTNGQDEPPNFSCSSGSNFNSGAFCQHHFKNKYFAWHPADKAKGSTLDSYCSPTGDYCLAVTRRHGRIKFEISTFSFSGKYEICVKGPAGRECKSSKLRDEGNLYSDRVDWLKKFDSAGPGRQKVVWKLSGTTLGEALHFQANVAKGVGRAAGWTDCGNWSQDVRDVEARNLECSNANRALDRYFDTRVEGGCSNFFEPCTVGNYRCDGERRTPTSAVGKCKRTTRRGVVRWHQVLSHKARGNKTKVLCWNKNFPDHGPPNIKSEPSRCHFFKRGESALFAAVLFRTDDWDGWGKRKAKASGEYFEPMSADPWLPVNVRLSKPTEHCGRIVYSKATFDFQGRTSDFKLWTC